MRLLALLIVCFASTSYALPPAGGGALPEPGDVSEQVALERALLRAHSNAMKYRALQVPGLQAEPAPTELQWPVREAIGVTAQTVQAISNFVDQDDSEVGTLDYNCGERTYDGHRGLDVFIAPYSWYKMERDEGIVVAAAAGRIVEKVQDQPERSCSSTDPDSDNNVLVIEHEDGSLAIYAHMRTNSLTKKPLGSMVRVGEYLGVVGSAGYSTGPHLHFEVGRWEQEGDALVWQHRDPFAGSCNGLNIESWWQEQPAYHQSRLQAIATHDDVPNTPDCPGTEQPHYNDIFEKGQRVYVAAYYRDQRQGQESEYTLRRPDGSVYYEWTHASDHEFFSSSWWYWYFDMPTSVPSGKWSFSVKFQGEELTQYFWIDDAPQPNPPLPVANNAYNGLWFDPSLDGEGYNIITFASGTIIYFYGNDASGRRLWLTSDVLSEPFANGEDVKTTMYESSGGVFSAPISSGRGLSPWGKLQITFSDCSNSIASLEGLDGDKVSMLVKLTGVPGSACIDGTAADGAYSGLWFDPSLDGEGFNVLISPVGMVIYYYGFDVNGDPLWLIGGPIGQTLEPGKEIAVSLLKAPAGTFAMPVSGDELVPWGSVTLAVDGCSGITMTMDTPDGTKLSETVQLVGVVGLACE